MDETDRFVHVRTVGIYQYFFPPADQIALGAAERGINARDVAGTRFRRHRVRCFDGTGGASLSGGSLRESSSLRLCG